MTMEELRLEAQCRAQEYMEQHGKTQLMSDLWDWPYPITYAYFIQEDYGCIHLTRIHCTQAKWAECWIETDEDNFEPATVHKIYTHYLM